MTVSTTLATCPRCGEGTPVFAIFIRSDDRSDLVCRSNLCRGGIGARQESNPSQGPPRRIFGRRQR